MSALSPAVAQRLARVKARKARIAALSERDLRMLVTYLCGYAPGAVDTALEEMEEK